jgi:hypothetical protein
MNLKRFWIFAFSLLASAQSFADSFDICWTPPTQFVNGDALLEQDLDYYTLYMNDAEVMSFDVIVGTWCVEYITHVEGTYTAELTVTHMNGQTSDRSNQSVFTLGPRKPKAPANVRVVAR